MEVQLSILAAPETILGAKIDATQLLVLESVQLRRAVVAGQCSQTAPVGSLSLGCPSTLLPRVRGIICTDNSSL